MNSAKAGGAAFWIEVSAFLVLILVVQLFGFSLRHSPLIDEVFHLLSARSWATDGTLAIADGQYTRAAGFTIVLGILFSLFGEDLVLARSISVLAGALWAAALFAWLQATAGRPAAWIAALLFALTPTSVFLFHTVRFYALHGLVFFLGAIGLYALVTERVRLASPAGVVLTLCVALAFAVAFHLQPVTVTGLVGLAIWMALERGRRVSMTKWRCRRFQLLLGGRVLLAAFFAVLLFQTDFGANLWHTYRQAAPWNTANQDNVLYYHYFLLGEFPVLWALLPVAALFALVRCTVPALFCICIFGTVVILHSLAGMKAPRYIHLAVPFFCVLWGITVAEAIPFLRGLSVSALERLLPQDAWPRLRQVASTAFVGVPVAFFIAGMPGLKETIKMARSWPEFPSHPDAAWATARPFLQPWLDKAEVVLTTNGFHSIYYFGRFDYQVSPAAVAVTESGEEFGRDRRTGRPAISTPDSLRLVISCHASGLFVGDPFQWRHEVMGTTGPVADLLETNAERIEVPDKWDLRVYYWEGTPRPPDPQCANLPSFAGRSDAPLAAVEPTQ